MKAFCLLLVATFFISTGFSQTNSIIQNFSVYPVRSIQASDEDFSDLQFLKEVLNEKRIVLLGEQSHGDGATFEAKVRLIKFLHQEMGFDMLSFESDLLDGYWAWQQVKDTNYKESLLRESIYSIWSESKEGEALIKYVHEQASTNKPLMVMGFDCQGSTLLPDGLLAEIKETIGNLTLSEEEVASIEQVQETGAEFLVDNEADSVLFFTAIKKVSASLKKSLVADSTMLKSILQQSLAGWVQMIQWQIDKLRERDVKVQNPRDLQMALNLIYLTKLYPNKKIVAWGASYHFANEIERWENTLLTKQFIKRMDSLQHSHEPTDLNESLNGAVPMGRILKKHFGESLYSLAFSSFDGAFGMLGFNPVSLGAVQPPQESIEQALVAGNKPLALVNFNAKTNQKFYSSALGNLPMYAPWQFIFDGLFFIKTSYPPSFPEHEVSQTKEAIEKVTVYTTTGSARLIDAVTKKGIEYANISLVNTTKGVATNAAGEFTFIMPGAKPTDLVVLSSIGYETDTLSVRELTSRKEFLLNPKTYLLAEMEIRSKPLSAREIIKQAEKKIKDNYIQQPHEQEFFYRVSDYKEDSVLSNEEAAVLVYDPVGYKSTGNVSKRMKGKILQFRNTTDNSDKDIWSGVGSLWLVYTHDAVLDKDNVLHRSGFYDLSLLGISAYENKRVYEIAFSCKRPGAFTTGFGYPSPISATGKIYIEVGSFAVLKVETLIYRRPYQGKKNPHLRQDPYGHQLVQTYKEVDGKYMLNYSRHVHFGKWHNSKENWSYRSLSVRELLSTEVNLQPVSSSMGSLTSIKSRPVEEDVDFWNHHNTVIHDDVKDLLKLIER